MIIPKPLRWSSFVLQMYTIFSFALVIVIIGLIFVPKSDFHCVSSTFPSPITFLKRNIKERKLFSFFSLLKWILMAIMSSKITYTEEICPSQPPAMIRKCVCVFNDEFLCWFCSDFGKKGIFVQDITIVHCIKPIHVSSFFRKIKTPMSFSQIYPIIRAITKTLKMIKLNKASEQ